MGVAQQRNVAEVLTVLCLVTAIALLVLGMWWLVPLPIWTQLVVRRFYWPESADDPRRR